MTFESFPKRMGCYCLTEKKCEYDWSFVNKVYCICLKERNDRYQQIVEDFHKIGLCRITTFYRPIRDVRGGEAGCYESHRAVLTDALLESNEHVLVLEDDAQFVKLTPKKLRRVKEEYSKFRDTNSIYHLGHYSILSVMVTLRTKIAMPEKSTLAHAYIVGRNVMEEVSNAPYNNIAIDVWYRRYRQYSFFPMLVTQNGTKSSISTMKESFTKFKPYQLLASDKISTSLPLLGISGAVVLSSLLLL